MPPRKKKAAKANDDELPLADKPIENRQSDSSDDEEEAEGGVRVCGVYVPPAPKAICSSESTGPRLMITQIVNINFKSYAGRTILGPFDKSFTSIIGPNGSGKSNVIDSMLFVFGFKTSKIRSKKLSVLMHKSESLQDVRSCTVEVHFQLIIDKEGRDFDVVPNSEFVISRTATIENTSFYCINGKKSKFKEVSALLGLHGIDLIHNRFLILQGEVEQIAMMKRKAANEHESGLLEYLDDLIGTTRYRKPLIKLEEKLERLIDEMQEKVNRCKMAESDYVALKGPFETAKEYLKTSNRYATLQNKMFQKAIHVEQCKLDEVDKQKEEIENKISELKKKRDDLQSEHLTQEKERTSKRKLKEEKQAEKDKMANELQDAEFRWTRITEDVKHLNKKRKKATEATKTEEKKLADAEKVPEKNASEVEELEILEKKLEKQKSAEEEAQTEVLASIQKLTQGPQDLKDEINNKLIGLNKIRDDAKAKFDLATTEREAYLNNEKRAKDRLELLKTTLEEKTASLGEKTSQLEDLKAKLPASEAELSECQKKLPALKQEEKVTTEKLHTLNAQIQEKRDLMQARTSRNRVLDFIMKQKEKGILPGVFGRLGDLGGIDAKYDCAISTACNCLDFIVTDTAHTAKSCVQELKKHDVGRGNFLVLEQQEWLKPMYEKSIKTPENAPRLFDLVKVKDNKVKPAFYYALRDTLVANDLVQAKRCAYGATRYRVVTLNGEIIELAGTMTGGGREKKTGKMGRSATVNVESSSTQDLDSKVPQIQARVAQLHSEISQLEEKIGVLSRDTKSWKQQINNLQIEIKGLNQHGGELKNQIKEQAAAVKAAASDPEEVRRLDEIVAKNKKKYDKAVEESAKLENEVKVLSDKIELLSGGKVKEAKARLEKVNSQFDKVRAEIRKLNVGIQTSIRNTTKHKTQIENLAKEILQAEEKMCVLGEEKDELVKVKTLLNEKIEFLNIEISEINDSLSKADSCMGNYAGDINKIKEKILKEKKTLETYDRTIQEFKKVIADHQIHLNQLKLYEIEGEEDADNENTPLKEQGACAKVLPIFPPEVLDTFDSESLLYTRDHLDTKIKEGNIDECLRTVQDFKEKHEIYKAKSTELAETSKLKTEVKDGLEQLKNARLTEFMSGFSIISNKLKEMYQMITLGGDAELDFDSMDPYGEGINFTVRPPKKSWKVISNLSGGEKTLSSLALVFALHYYKPSPLYVMDEIDAALDFKNVSIVANYIKERTKNAQFIIISLRTNMFELANVLVGIYKTYNCTKTTTITVKEKKNEDNTVGLGATAEEIVSPTIQSSVQNFSPAIQSSDQIVPNKARLPHSHRTSLFEDDNDRTEGDVSFEDLDIDSIQNEPGTSLGPRLSRPTSSANITDSEEEDSWRPKKKLRPSTSPQ